MALAWAVPQGASARSLPELKLACAQDGSGQLRYAASRSDCDLRTESVVSLPSQAPVYACVSLKYGLAYGNPGAKPVVVPLGTLWLTSDLGACKRAHQRGIALGGERSLEICAMRRGGLLRYVRHVNECHKREQGLIVPAVHRPKRLKRKSRKPKNLKTPTPVVKPPPVADPQTLSTPEETPLSIVLSGASVPAGEPLTYAVATQPVHGKLSGTPPYLTYTPAAGYVGSDQLTFTVTQNKIQSTPATVAITVLHVDRPPVISLPQMQSTEENASLSFSIAKANGVSVTDPDAEGGVERLKLSVEHGTLEVATKEEPGSGTSKAKAASASVTIEGTLDALNTALEGLVYTPTHNYDGSDMLTVEADDLGHTGFDGPKTVTAKVAVSVLPIAYDKAVADAYTTKENETLTVAKAAGVLANDTDSDTPPLPLSAVLVSGPSHGTLTLEADGSLKYVPTHDFYGTDSFTYKDNDGNTESNTVTVTLTVELVVYDTAVADSYSLNENETLSKSASAGVLANDTDSDTPPLGLKAALVSGPSHGTLTLQSNGEFTYEPTHNYVGGDSFTYKDNDGNTESNTVTVTLTVEPVVYDTAVADSYTANENETLVKSASAGVLTNDTDSDLPALSLEAVLVSGPSHGTLKLQSNGEFEYVPTHDFHGTDSFTYKDNDGNTESNTVSVTLTVEPAVYDTAVADSYTTNENETLSKSVSSGVLANDTDSDSPAPSLEAVLVSGPSHGTLKLQATGEFEYVPNHNFHGIDSFTYKDYDSNTYSNTVTVTLTVEPVVYDTAVADSYTAHENETLSKTAIEGVLSNDTDTDSPALSLEALEVSGPSHGTLTLSPSGSFEYTPAHNYVGTDSFTYKDNDGNTDSNTVTVTLTVEPVVYDTAVADSYTTNENETLSVPAVGVLGNDTDSDSPPLALSAVVVSDPSHGSLTLSSDGSFEYIPGHDFHGTDSFTYKDNDGNTESNTVTVTLTVEPVVYDTAVADSYTANENETLVKSASAGVLTNDTDSDSPALSLEAVLVSGPSHGTLKLQATGEFEYVPNHNFHGTDSFTYKDNDGNADSNTATVTLTVEPVVYDTAVADSYSLNENETLVKNASSGVLSNDTDSDSPALSLEAVLVSGPSHGTLKLQSNGEFEYVPTHNFHGTDSFTYKDNDGNADSNTVTVTLTVEPVVYDTAVADAYSLNENETLVKGASSGVLANDTDSDSPALSLEAVLASGPSHGTLKLQATGEFEYVPNHNFHGTDSFTYKDNDGNTDSNTVTVMLTVEPVVYDTAVADSYTAHENETLSKTAIEGVLSNDTDTDSPALTLEAAVVNGPSHGTLKLEPSGEFEYVPTHNFHGTDSFTYKDNDGNTESNTVTVTLTVEPVVYDTAVADSYTTHENEVLSVASSTGVLANDTDSDSPALSLEAVLVSGPSHGALKLQASGEFEYTPTHNYVGSDSFTYKDSDGNTESNTVTVTLTIERTAYDKAVADSYTAHENETLSKNASSGVLANDTDSESLPLEAVLVSTTAHGTLKLQANGEFEYTPTHNFHGTDSFTYKDYDTNTYSNTVTVTLTVEPVVYDTAVADSYAAHENETLAKSAIEGVLSNDTDTDSPALSLEAVLVSGPSHGTLKLQSNGEFEYVPTHNFHGTDSFTYKDNDGNTDSNEVTVTLTVEPVVYDTAVADSYTAHENETLSKTAIEGVLSNDTDTDSPALSLEALEVSGPSHGTLTLSPSGSFEYTPAHNYVGTDSFTYKDNDGNTDSNTVTVTLTVEPVVYDTAVADSYAAHENETLSKSASEGVLANDTDSDSPALSLEAVLVSGPSHGTLTLRSDGSFEYTPDSGFYGDDTFTYKDDDGNTYSNTVTVTLTVEPHVNEAPSVSAPTEAKVNENTSSAKTTLVFSKADSNQITMTDKDAEGGVEKLELAVSHGTLTPHSATGLTVAGSGTASLTLEGTLTAIGEGLEGLTYTPTLEYTGSDTLTLKADDNGHTGEGGAKTATANVSITVAAADPTPINPTFTGAVGNTELAIGESRSAAPEVVKSGSVLPSPAEGPDKSTLEAKAGTIETEHHGSVSMNTNGSFTYQPPLGLHSGTDKFSYEETDSLGGKATGTATIDFNGDRVWYVNGKESATGTGASSSPFKSVSSAESAAAKGDVIFLYAGSTYSGGVKLKEGQTLDGQAKGLTVSEEEVLAESGTYPRIEKSAGPVVTIASEDAVNGVEVKGAKGNGIEGTGLAGEVTLTNNKIVEGAERGIELKPSSTAKLTLSITHNTFLRQYDGDITINPGTGAEVDGKIDKNTIGEAGKADSGTSNGGQGIWVIAEGSPDTTTVEVSENEIFQMHGGTGIWLEAFRGSARLNATVLKNKIEMLDPESLQGLEAQSGEVGTDSNTLCLNAVGNTIKAAGIVGPQQEFPAAAALLEVREGGTFELEKTGSGATVSDIEEVFEKENTVSVAEGSERVLAYETGGKAFTPFGGTCPTP